MTVELIFLCFVGIGIIAALILMIGMFITRKQQKMQFSELEGVKHGRYNNNPKNLDDSKYQGVNYSEERQVKSKKKRKR